MLVYLRADTGKKQGIGLLFLIFFSGMDILGALYSSRLPDLLAYDAMHLEWWTNDFQFSSLTTCLFWVFNPDSGGMAGNRLLFAGERLPQLPAAGHAA